MYKILKILLVFLIGVILFEAGFYLNTYLQVPEPQSPTKQLSKTEPLFANGNARIEAKYVTDENMSPISKISEISRVLSKGLITNANLSATYKGKVVKLDTQGVLVAGDKPMLILQLENTENGEKDYSIALYREELDDIKMRIKKESDTADVLEIIPDDLGTYIGIGDEIILEYSLDVLNNNLVSYTITKL